VRTPGPPALSSIVERDPDNRALELFASASSLESEGPDRNLGQRPAARRGDQVMHPVMANWGEIMRCH